MVRASPESFDFLVSMKSDLSGSEGDPIRDGVVCDLATLKDDLVASVLGRRPRSANRMKQLIREDLPVRNVFDNPILYGSLHENPLAFRIG